MHQLLKFIYSLSLNLLVLFLIPFSYTPIAFSANSGGTWVQVTDKSYSHISSSGIITLDSGKVLVTTGNGQGGITNKSELFDPLSRTWSSTGDVNEARSLYGNAIVKLEGGKVMIAGGEGANVTDIGSVELYDPQTEVWSFTDPLKTPRRYAAIVLENGKVLVTAGANGIPNNDRFLSSTEIFDPQTDTWTSSGSLNVPREGIIDIVLLNNGKVLLAGGYTLNDRMTNYAEIYDPATGLWSTSRIPVDGGWSGGTMTVLENGKVLLAGGVTGYWTNNTTVTNKAWLFDPSNNTWSQTGSMSTIRSGHSSARLSDGKVLVIGGGSKQTNIYDPASGTWTLAKMTKYPSYNGIASLQNRDVLAIGGDPEGKSAELFTNEPILPTPTNTPTPTPTSKMPVILIPGIMGSEFEVKENIVNSGIKQCTNPLDDYEYKKGDTVWIDPARVLLDYAPCGRFLNVLQLQPNGLSDMYPQVGLKESILNTIILGQHIGYYDTIPFFLEKGYLLNKDFFIFPYDWRKDLSQNIDALNDKIDTATQSAGTSKAQIVAHSMGGLIARDYIRNTEHAQKIDTLVTLGTPLVGTPTFLAHLLYNKCIKALGIVCVINGDEIKKLVQNFPGAFELLPSKKYYDLYPELYPFNELRDVDDDGNINRALNYSQLRTLLTHLDKNMTLFDKAEDYHDSLDPTYDETNGVNVYMIAGSGQATIGQIRDYSAIQIFGLLPTIVSKQDAVAVNGDDTVPLLSATAGQLFNLNDVYYVKQTHSDLPSGTALQMAYNLLNGQTDYIPGVLPAPYPIDGQIISVHSPVEINAYDEQGHHTGLKDDGTVEVSIPGSSYDYIGESKFIYLPDGGDYTLKTKATDEGSFDLKIKTYSESELVKEQLYLTVPQTSETTTSMVLDTENPILKVDSDNDGMADENLFPSSTLTGGALADTDTPATTIQAAGTEGTNSWYKSNVTLSFSAEDPDSGVLKTYYYIDGEQALHEGSTSLIIDTDGTTKVWYFSVDRAGNIETPKSITIKIDKTAPEAEISYDLVSFDATIIGADNLGSASAVLDKTKPLQPKYTITDQAGNTLVINTGKIKIGKQAALTIKSLKYNDEPVIDIDRNVFFTLALTDKNNTVKQLDQYYSLKDDKKIFTAYSSSNDLTKIFTRMPGSADYTREDKPGIVLLQLYTEQGGLKYRN